MNDIVNLKISNHIATVTLNRPEKKNALSKDMFNAISLVGENLKREKSVRVVILTGAGSDFCSGLDTSTFSEWATDFGQVRNDLTSRPVGEDANWFQKPCYVWQEIEVPVIAAIKGVAFGGGIQLALAADFRIAQPTSQFSIMESKWGIIPDLGITQNLPKLTRADVAKELIMTGRIFDGTEALDLGLITKVNKDPLGAANEFANLLIGKSPDVLKGAKKLIEQSWVAPNGKGLEIESDIQSRIMGYENNMEAVMATIQKRAAKFK